MMFERLPTIPGSTELIDRAFRRGSKAGRHTGEDADAVRTSSQILSDTLSSIVKGFPSLDGLSPFYSDLVQVTVGLDDLKIHLSRISWASKQIRKIARDYHRGGMGAEHASRSKRGALGRMASVIRSIDKDLLFLASARDLLTRLPSIDPEIPTIIIAGFPNVGKSSFLIRVTGARPQIASYPFTTKGLIVGHFERDDSRFQVVDTPGLLDRPMSKRNEIEAQAVTALRNLNGVALFIIDPSGHCGFPLDEQRSLLNEIRSWLNMPILVVANKSDLGDFPDADMSMSTLSGVGVPEVLDRLILMMKETAA
jgi:nucleolar GTP-binding protein